eukprot:TRINITY_DN18387_c0_g1_i2.p1 TRINITY_DN18387_c0_g1~~TRINITY_DN18387_c0_g1_i2.p1  ORF type:complete len:212 (+),score=30.35 TRINITY_DN18387_c0_g1_i2:135-770(+)
MTVIPSPKSEGRSGFQSASFSAPLPLSLKLNLSFQLFDADQVPNSTDMRHRVSSDEMKPDSTEPALHHNLMALQSRGRDKVFDAFRLLHINSSVQRLVVSLSSDKAVWNAILNNETVQELRESFCAGAENSRMKNSDRSPDVAACIMSWMVKTMQEKIMDFIEKITKIVNELFHPQDKEKKMDLFEDILSTSFMLSVMVVLIIIVTRISKG